jgi:hypothetical protein
LPLSHRRLRIANLKAVFLGLQHKQVVHCLSTWVAVYQRNGRHPIGYVCYRLSYPKGALLSRNGTIGLEEIGMMVGPVDVESF